jgi:hypothetical protein
MFTAQGEPMMAYFESSTSCGFREVKYIPTCNVSIFSKYHAQRQGMKISYDGDTDVFAAYDAVSDKTYLFPNISGMHFYCDKSVQNELNPVVSSELKPAVPTVQPVVPPTQTLEPELGLQVYMASRTRAVYEFLLIHQRLNHINYQYLWNYLSQGAIKGYKHNLKHVDVRLLPACKTCAIWKMENQKMPTMNSPPIPDRPGMVIAADLKKFNKEFYGRKNTVAVFVDYKSTATFSFWFHTPNSSKNALLNECFIKFYNNVCIPNGWLRFTFHPDNAQAFLSVAMLKFCGEHNIVVDPSVRYKSSTNGLAEAAIKVLFRASATLLATSRLPANVFPFAWKTAEDVHNSLPKLPSLHSPNFLLNGAETHVANFRSFGARCYLLNEKARSTQLEPPGVAGRWLAYCDRHRTKMFVYNEATKAISPLGDGNVTFDESNVVSFSEDRDLNEQLALLDAIDQPTEDTKSLVDVPLSVEPESQTFFLLDSAANSHQQPPHVEPPDVSCKYTHALKSVLCIVVIF